MIINISRFVLGFVSFPVQNMPCTGVLVKRVNLATSHYHSVGFCIALCVVSVLNSWAVQTEACIFTAEYEYSPCFWKPCWNYFHIVRFSKWNGKELMEKAPKRWGNKCSCWDTNLSPAEWSLLFLNLLLTASIATSVPGLWLKTENTPLFFKCYNFILFLTVLLSVFECKQVCTSQLDLVQFNIWELSPLGFQMGGVWRVFLFFLTVLLSVFECKQVCSSQLDLVQFNIWELPPLGFQIGGGGGSFSF